MSCNSFTIQSFVNFLRKVGRFQLENAMTTTRDWVWSPAHLLLFALANHSLQRLDVRGIRFCAGARDELAPDLALGRAIYSHPSLCAMYLEPCHFITGMGGPLAWTHLLYHMLTNMVFGSKKRGVPRPTFSFLIDGPSLIKWTVPMPDLTTTHYG